MRWWWKRSSPQTVQGALRPGASKASSLDEVETENHSTATFSRGRRRTSRTSEYSDLTVTCGDRTWAVHKFVLCTQSEFFRNACKDHFKEGKEKTIRLEEDDPQVVHAMLDFLYENEYEPPVDVNQWAFHVHMAAIADKYFIGPLETYAEGKFDRYDEITAGLKEFPDAILATYDTENKCLRSTVIAVVKSNYTHLFSRKKNEDSAFKQVLQDAPEFAAAVAEALAEQLLIASDKLSTSVRVSKKAVNSMRWYYCPSDECTEDELVFSLPARHCYGTYISCPRGCSFAHDRSSNWWAKYRIESPLSPME